MARVIKIKTSSEDRNHINLELVQSVGEIRNNLGYKIKSNNSEYKGGIYKVYFSENDYIEIYEKEFSRDDFIKSWAGHSMPDCEFMQDCIIIDEEYKI